MVWFGMDPKRPSSLLSHMSQGNIEKGYQNCSKKCHLIYTRKMINCLQRQFSLGLHFCFYQVGRPDERPENAAMTIINSSLQKETHAPYSWLQHVFMDRQSLGVYPHRDVWDRKGELTIGIKLKLRKCPKTGVCIQLWEIRGLICFFMVVTRKPKIVGDNMKIQY